MAQSKYETPIDANFVLAYDTYNHQVEEMNRAANKRNRRSNPAYGQESGPTVDRQKDTKLTHNNIEERVTESNLMRYALSSILIGYTAAIVYFMVADGSSTIGATRL